MSRVVSLFLEILAYFIVMLNGREMQSGDIRGRDWFLQPPLSLSDLSRRGLHDPVLGIRDPVCEEYFKKVYMSRFSAAQLKESKLS